MVSYGVNQDSPDLLFRETPILLSSQPAKHQRGNLSESNEVETIDVPVPLRECYNWRVSNRCGDVKMPLLDRLQPDPCELHPVKVIETRGERQNDHP